jgi:predicted nucleic acid-binding protein
MILVDSSVWIDHFRGVDTPQSRTLDRLLGMEPLAIGDLILTEVLQGFGADRDFNTARRLLGSLELVNIGGPDVAIKAAQNHRTLRSLGITVRKTIDTVIATRCIVSGHVLLHSDRDFEAFEQHLGLRCVDIDN